MTDQQKEALVERTYYLDPIMLPGFCVICENEGLNLFLLEQKEGITKEEITTEDEEFIFGKQIKRLKIKAPQSIIEKIERRWNILVLYQFWDSYTKRWPLSRRIGNWWRRYIKRLENPIKRDEHRWIKKR